MNTFAASQPPIPALVKLLRAGQMEQLVVQARECAGRWPQSGPVWHLLGLAHLNLGQPGEAVGPLTKAGKMLPQDADVAEHLAIALLQSGRLKEAYRTFERHLALAPGSPGSLLNLAHIANETGNHASAERHCRQAMRLAPGQPEALFNLGRALRGLGKPEAAIAAFREAQEKTGDSPVAQNDIGLQLQELGALAEAEACFRRAIAIAPRYARAHSNLGRLLEKQDKAAEALACFRQAIALEPDLAGAYANMGSLFNSQRRHAESEAASRQAIALDPHLAAGHGTLADALMGQWRHDEAEASYRQALALDGDNADVIHNYANLLLDRRRFDEALACYRRLPDQDGSALGNAHHCAAHLCDWRHNERDAKALYAWLEKDSSGIGPFGLLAIPDEADGALRQRRAGWLYAIKKFRALLEQPPLVAADAHPRRDRLRIGYLSADFHNHATMHLLGGALAAHNRQRFAVHLYSYGRDVQDESRSQAIAAAEVFRDLAPLSDRDAAAQIVADGIDILVDLKGYTQESRLAISALRPAPLIVSWLGYPGTLGHERLADYLIGDPVVTPPEHAGHFSEVLALLPNCYQPNDRDREIGPCPSRREAGLPDEGFVFCSFNQSYKFNPLVFDIWCRLLKAVPGSVLWLLEAHPAANANLRREAARRGLAPERLVFAARKPAAEHLGRLQLADLTLDTFPYGSHTTGSDALWAGVPLLTRIGNTFASRVGASLLRAVGLAELVTESWEEYLELARSLALQPERLADLRARLAAQRLSAPLFDTARFTRDLERLYEAIWENHGQGRKDIVHLA